MRAKHRVITLFVACSAFVLSSVLLPAVASADPSIDVLLDDLSSPKGLALFKGDPIVGQGAFGPPGPILRYVLKGRHKGEAIPLTDPINVVDVAIASDTSGWAIGGDQVLYHRDADGTIEPVLDFNEFQAEHPDPYDQEGAPEETNPYGLIMLANGDALVADAAGNDLVRVTPEGEPTVVARFDVEAISTDHLPPDAGFPPTIDAESVPTSVTLGPDGDVLVGELKGFPFRPGSSHVWRVDPDEEEALCSVNTPDDDCTIVEEGLTAINDIAWDHAASTLYVYELAEDGVLAFEEGFDTGEFPDAVLLQIKNGDRTELAEGDLSQPGGVVVGNRGTIFVTDGVFSNGRLIRVHR